MKGSLTMAKKDEFLENPLKNRKKKKRDRDSFLTPSNSDIEVVAQANAEIIEIRNEDFDYDELDEDTKEFLKEKERQLFQTAKNFYTILGNIFYEVREELADHYQGLFGKWLKSIGVSRSKAYRLINRYELIQEQENLEKKKIIENLPLTLAYNLTKEKVPEELKQMVLNQEITTISEFQALLEPEKKEKKSKKKDETMYKFSDDTIETKKDKLFSKLKGKTINDKSDLETILRLMLKILSQ